MTIVDVAVRAMMLLLRKLAIMLGQILLCPVERDRWVAWKVCATKPRKLALLLPPSLRKP